MPISSKLLTAVITLSILSLPLQVSAALSDAKERVRDEILKCGVQVCSVAPQEMLGERPSENLTTLSEGPKSLPLLTLPTVEENAGAVPPKLPVELRAIIR